MDTPDFEDLCGFDPVGKSRAQLEAVVERCGRVSAFVAAKKYAALAALESLGDAGPAPADTSRAKTRESSRAAKRAAATATEVAHMPGLQEALENGDISPEHADAAAAAAKRISPEAADHALTALARQLPADRFAKEADEWAGRHEDPDITETRQERARRERCGRVWRKNNGRIGIHGELDAAAGNPVLIAFEQEMERLYKDDGGRDADASAQRSFQQRGADALTNLLGLPSTTATGSNRPHQPHPRYMSHLRVDLGRCTSRPTGSAAFVDGTPIPQAMLERIACESAFVGAVYGAEGAILWQGRSVRLATDDQWHALIDRDGGCRHCGADPSRCRAHHITPWAPPARGPTDIDHLVLVCDHGHHLIHDSGWRVVRDDDGDHHVVPP